MAGLSGPRHTALVLTTPTAARGSDSGAAQRVQDVRQVLHDAGYVTEEAVVDRPPSGRWCLVVGVSYVTATGLRGASGAAPRTWLDAVDSWLTVNGTGVAAGRLSYAARAARDLVHLLRLAPADLVTYISAKDLAADRGTVRGSERLVLPGTAAAPALRQSVGGRLVLAGDWDYPPNRDGLCWFRRRVLPHLPRIVDVYGSGKVRRHPQLRLHGHVADPGQLYCDGDVHLAPLRYGGGVKRKVLQPLAAGLRVVATPSAAQGLRPHPNLEVARGSTAFAEAALRAQQAGAPSSAPALAELWDGDDRGQVVEWLQRCPH